ncbi:hypothetical protein CPT_MTx_014 [Serratia phage MTx]|uniref:Uncharacterized protein n=1 Tax=Serratia phage MTx TaxID=2557553 RepID=A0A482MGP7_9CAUD|nr:hypothetical protein HWC15_gp014 [Serratia phage MTx]QBQ72320.1 hypothetical protein CPT_MTx_014 [Serratia phage MTx]
MKRVLMVVIVLWIYAAIQYAMYNKAFAADVPKVAADPVIEGFSTYAKIHMPYGNTLYLSGAYKDCPVDYRYGMVMNGGGNISKWFCWRLNKEFGTIESTDQYSLTVEEFDWTEAGKKFLRKEVHL